MVWLFITLIYRIYRNTNIKSYSSSCNLIKHWGGGWHERTNSVVNSEQETKMEGVQHVYYKNDNIDAALVCEDRLREHTWTINGKFHPPLHQRVGGMKVRVLRQFQNKKSKWKPFNMFPMEGMKYYLWGQHWCSSGLWKQVEGAHANHQWEISRSRCSPSRNLKGHTWTIDWRTISLWPWSRERSRGNKRLPRLHWSFGNNNLEEIGGSRPLYSSPTMWSWGSRINFYLSTIYLIFDIWYLILHYLLSLV